MHWYKRDPNAALMGMATLSLEDRGAYNTILDLLYASDGNLPDDDRAIAKLMHVQMRTWLPIRKRLIEAGKIWSFEGKIFAKRVEKELKTARELSEKQSETADKRWQKQENPKENNSNAMPPGIALTSTSTSTSTKKRKRKPVAEPPEFLDFWNSVPRKEGRYEAVVAYCKAIETGADPPKINAAAKRWRIAEEKTEEKYIALPATWLNKRRYEDYHAPPERETNLEFDPQTKEWRWKRGFEPESPERTN